MNFGAYTFIWIVLSSSCVPAKKSISNQLNISSSIKTISHQKKNSQHSDPFSTWLDLSKDWHRIDIEDGSSSIETFYVAAGDSVEEKSHSIIKQKIIMDLNKINSKDKSHLFDESKHKNLPYFDHPRITNISEHVGGHAYLPCVVKNLGDGTVSWTRQRDWHILTSGNIVYTNDERFQILHKEDEDQWTLIIKYVQIRDNGTYECQVSSAKGSMIHFFNLNVMTPSAHILGAKNYHVQKGTVINLVCIVENSPKDQQQYLLWYHDNQVINFGQGISVHTEPGIHTHSKLTIPSAGHQHAGNYTCGATNTQSATVQVYVSDGDKTAAIQSKCIRLQYSIYWTTLMTVLEMIFQKIQCISIPA